MADAIVHFEGVTLQATDRYDQEVRGIDFRLGAGECLLIEVDGERACPPLADTAQGLIEPTTGRVWVEGRDWSALSAEAVARCRGRIGRVFEDHAWLSNLDVDENVTLAQRHHSGRTDDVIRDEALRWATRFGRDGLPAMRPAWAPRHELVVAQWVRALLGEPHLLILERPTRDIPDDESALLVDAVREQRARGVAVLWLASDERLLNNQSLHATQRAKIAGDRWEILG